MEVSKHARATSSLLSSPSKQRMFRSINSNSNYRNYKNIQYFGSSTSLLQDHQNNNKRNNYPETNNNNNINNINNNNNNPLNNFKEVHSSSEINHDNLISYEHLSETSSWIELVLPFTIFAITIIGVIFIAFILFAWIRKTFREEENNQQHRIASKKVKIQQKSEDEEKVKIFEERLKCSKKCEKNNKNYSKSQNKMNSRKWLRDKEKQTVDNSIVVSDDVEKKLETIEFKKTPPTSPNSQKDTKEEEEDEDEQMIENASKIEEQQHPLETNPFACPVALSDISVTSVIQPQTSW